jgi:isoleucyl-tRNA synthetase
MTDEKHKPLDYRKLNSFAGSELIGLEYDPLFETDIDPRNPFKIWYAEFVNDEDGTGIAHE